MSERGSRAFAKTEGSDWNRLAEAERKSWDSKVKKDESPKKREIAKTHPSQPDELRRALVAPTEARPVSTPFSEEEIDRALAPLGQTEEPLPEVDPALDKTMIERVSAIVPKEKPAVASPEVKLLDNPLTVRVERFVSTDDEKISEEVDPAFCVGSPEFGTFSFVADTEGDYDFARELAVQAEARLDKEAKRTPVYSLPVMEIDDGSGALLTPRRNEAQSALLSASKDIDQLAEARMKAVKSMDHPHGYLIGRIVREPIPEESPVTPEALEKFQAFLSGDNENIERKLTAIGAVFGNYEWQTRIQEISGSGPKKIKKLLETERAKLTKNYEAIEQQMHALSESGARGPDKFANLSKQAATAQEALRRLEQISGNVERELAQAETISDTVMELRHLRLELDDEQFDTAFAKLTNRKEIKALDRVMRQILFRKLNATDFPTVEYMGEELLPTLEKEDQSLVKKSVTQVENFLKKMGVAKMDVERKVFLLGMKREILGLPKLARGAFFQEIRKKNVELPESIARLLRPGRPLPADNKDAERILDTPLNAQQEDAVQKIYARLSSHPEFAEKIPGDAEFSQLEPIARRVLADRLERADIINKELRADLLDQRFLHTKGRPGAHVGLAIIRGDGNVNILDEKFSSTEKSLTQSILLEKNDRVVVYHKSFRDTDTMTKDTASIFRELEKEVRRSPHMDAKDISTFIQDRTGRTHLVLETK